MPPCWDVGTRRYLHRLYTSDVYGPFEFRTSLGTSILLTTAPWALQPAFSVKKIKFIILLVGCYGFTSLQRYFSHITTRKQEITNLWNLSGETGNWTPDLLLHKILIFWNTCPLIYVGITIILGLWVRIPLYQRGFHSLEDWQYGPVSVLNGHHKEPYEMSIAFGARP